MAIIQNYTMTLGPGISVFSICCSNIVLVDIAWFVLKVKEKALK